MLAKLTSNNQLTPPKRVLDSVGVGSAPAYFEAEDERIVLTPARQGSAEAVRRKLAELGIAQNDVAEAVAWARHSGKVGTGAE